MSMIPPGADLSKIPMAENPNGNPPNFVNPPTQNATVLAVGLPFAIISTCFVVLRLVTNFKNLRHFGLDDYLCVAAQILTTVYFGLHVSFKNSARHAYDIPLSFIDESYVKRMFAQNLVVGPALWSSKAAILSLYIRLFAPKKWLRVVSYFALVVMFILYWVTIPLAAIFCTPHDGGPWDRVVIYRCRTVANMSPIQGAVCVAADFFILILPLPIVFRLNLNPKKKIGLAIVFLVGVFAVFTSCVSLYYRIILHTGIDKLWHGTKVAASIVAEGYMTIVISCAPAVSSFWVKEFSHSAFYSNIRSRILLLRSPYSTNTKEASAGHSKQQLPNYGSSSSHLVQDTNGGYELQDATCPRPHTEIHSSGKSSFVQKGVITKSTTIDQLSERSERS